MNNIFADAEAVKIALPPGKRSTLVGGCFDLLHVGHLHVLQFASTLEEILIVAVLSDQYCRRYKDQGRPVISASQRARMVASVRFVDYVYISEGSPSDRETLETLRPHSVVFEEESRGSSKLLTRVRTIEEISPHTRIRFLPRYNEEAVSTGLIIKRIRTGR